MENSRWIWQDRYDHPAAWSQKFEPIAVPEMLEASAARAPDAVLIDFYGRRYRYREVLDCARRFAHALIGLGIGKGDRVGLYLPNVPHYVAAYYGALMAGAIVVNFSPLYTAEELAHQAEDSGTRLLVTVTAKQLFGTAMQVLETSCIERLIVGSIAPCLPPVKRMLYRLFKSGGDATLPEDDKRILRFSAFVNDPHEQRLPKLDPEADLALIQYTGGTTGRPKGAMLTHQNITANARQINLIDPGIDGPDRIMGVLPFFHVFANASVLNRTVAHGGLIVMLPRFDADQLLSAISRTKATSLPGVPTMFQALLDHPRLAKTNFSSVRVGISGGAPLTQSLKDQFEAKTGMRLVEGYGLTECSGVAAVNPYDLPGKAGTIGQPLPATRIKLLDRENPRKAAKPGEPGEIAISGPQIMKGYWHNPEADKDVFVLGYLRTGDVGTIDADGYIRVVDRIKDMIAVGGFKVFPSEVEAVLYRHPAVREALVIGVPDDYHGELPKAFVTLKSDADPVDGEALRTWVNPQLGKHERVCAVEIRDHLPRTLVGKLSRKELVAEERAKAQKA
ncbi:MAG: long-chain fatty acid--CoA ligase [Sphingobium sp.]|nr:long-chain fatty acid--CoA ligase [Sphingobium sp.]